jgi:YhcH/YjgK/YiaL family protein
LDEWRRIQGIEGLEAGFEFIEKTDLATLPLGKHEIQGDAVFALAMKAPSKTTDEARFESHRDYIDIQ